MGEGVGTALGFLLACFQPRREESAVNPVAVSRGGGALGGCRRGAIRCEETERDAGRVWISGSKEEILPLDALCFACKGCCEFAPVLKLLRLVGSGEIVRAEAECTGAGETERFDLFGGGTGILLR